MMSRFLATLPFRSQDRFDESSHFDVSAWSAEENLCELSDTRRCDTVAGVYYGSAEDDTTRFCPRHFYEMHFGPKAPYVLVDR